MKLKERIKTYNFWVSLSSAIFLILKLLGHQFGFHVDESLFSDLITSLCSILVILGIIVPPTKSISANNNFSNNQSDIKSQTIPDETQNEITVSNENLNKTIEENSVSNIDEIKNIGTQNNIDINTEKTNEISNDDNIQLSDINQETFDSNKCLNEDHSTINDNFEDITSQFDQILTEHEKFFENNINQYIEILQNKINQLNNK